MIIVSIGCVLVLCKTVFWEAMSREGGEKENRFENKCDISRENMGELSRRAAAERGERRKSEERGRGRERERAARGRGVRALPGGE